MAYEYQYESGIKNIIHRHNLWVSDTDYENAKESLNEAYRKAKYFDEIMKIDDQATDEDRITGEYESDIETVLSEYKERADDER